MTKAQLVWNYGLWLLILFGLQNSYANTTKLDSINRVLLSNPTDTSKVKLYFLLAREYRSNDARKALGYSLQARELSLKLNFTKGIIESNLLAGTSYYYLQNLDSAFFYLKKAVSLAEKTNYKALQSSSYSNLGVMYDAMGKVDSALVLFNKSLKIELGLGNKRAQLKRYNNIASIYSSMSNQPKALDYFLKSIELAGEVKDQKAIVMLLNNVGRSYQLMERWDKALEYYELCLRKSDKNHIGIKRTLFSNIGEIYFSQNNHIKALEYFKKVNSLNSYGIDTCKSVYGFSNLAQVYLKLNENDSALIYAQRSLEFAESCDFVESQYWSSLVMGKTYLAKGNLQLAEKAFLNSLARVPIEIINYNTSEALIKLSDLYRIKKDYKKALYYHRLYKNKQDSIFNDKRTREFARIGLEHDFENEKAILLAYQENEKILLEKEISYFRKSRNYLIIGVFIFSLLAYILYSFYKKEKEGRKIVSEKNRTISNQQQELANKAELLRESGVKIQDLSKFKESLAHMAVHDMKNPLNTIMGLSIGSPTEKKMKIINRSSAQMFNFITNMLDIYKFEQANIVLDLHTHHFSELVDEAESQVELLLNEKNMTLIKDVNTELTGIFDGTIIIRVLVNLLINAIKYSEVGSSILMKSQLLVGDNYCEILRLTIKDNGRGIGSDQLAQLFEPFNKNIPQKISKSASTGIGLNFCKMAIKWHKGQIEAESELGKGTSIIISLPLKRSECSESGKFELREEITSNLIIIEKERTLIKQFASELIKYKVHEVGKINQILREMESKGIKSNWKDRIQATVYSGDNIAFKNLIKEAEYIYGQ